MGADFILYSLPFVKLTPQCKKKLIEIASTMDLGECSGYDSHYDIDSEYRENVIDAIEDYESIDDRRDTCVWYSDLILSCDMPPLVFTGGLSCGDFPTDICSCFELLNGADPVFKELALMSRIVEV